MAHSILLDQLHVTFSVSSRLTPEKRDHAYGMLNRPRFRTLLRHVVKAALRRHAPLIPIRFTISA